MLDKLPTPPSKAMDRGSAVHDWAEEFITGKRPDLAPELQGFASLFANLRTGYQTTVLAEDTWAFRSDWTVTTYDDWAECWLRVKVDVAKLDGNRIDILDWKTGKFSPQWNVQDYELQLELYSLGALAMFGIDLPDIEVSPRLIYLDAGITYPAKPLVYTLDDLPRLQKEWTDRVQPMLNDRIFAPNPSRLCDWCAFSKSKGGPCEY
jgi:RecB family exonuclease